FEIYFFFSSRRQNTRFSRDWSSDVCSSDLKEFKDQYYSLYGVNPSDYSYKEYDAAKYFGNLLAKYGDDYPEYITKEKFEGLFSTYSFDYNESWGFVNNAVSFKSYQGSSFQLK